MPTRERRARLLGVAVSDLTDGRGRHGGHAHGPSHYAWNDSAMTSRDGYRLIRVGVGHPMADPNGYALEHRLVMATALGRPLLTSEIVHHINCNRLDNRVENLQVVTKSEHSRIHNAMKARDTRGCFTREFPGGQS